MTLRSRIPLLLAALALSGCTCNRNPNEGRLADNVGESFATCNEAEIRFLAAKHNAQLTFAPCGANKFSTFRWSPDGLRVYFQLVLSAHVMDADAPTKDTVPLAVPAPEGEATWLSNTRLAIPVVPSEEAPDVRRVAIVDVPQRAEEANTTVASAMTLWPVSDAFAIGQLQRDDTPGLVLLHVRQTKDGPGRIWRLDTSDGTVAPAFDWLTEPVDTYTYTPSQHALTVGRGDTVTLYDATTGAVLTTVPHAHRGTLDPQGRYLALEHLGTPVSVFHQRAWDEVSDQAREREQERAEAFADQLSDRFDKTVRPPSLSLLDRDNGHRWTLTGVQGDHFQWYEAAQGWGSFFLWGFESKQYKRNVALMNLNDHLSAVTEAREHYGMEPFTPPGDAPAPTEP